MEHIRDKKTLKWIEHVRSQYTATPHNIVLEYIEATTTVYLFRTDRDVILLRSSNKTDPYDEYLYRFYICFFRPQIRMKYWKHYDISKWKQDHTQANNNLRTFWYLLKSKHVFCNDRTVHFDHCTDKQLLMLPFFSPLNHDLVCSNCSASVDIEFFSNCTFKIDLLWKIWYSSGPSDIVIDPLDPSTPATITTTGPLGPTDETTDPLDPATTTATTPVTYSFSYYIEWLPEEVLKDIIAFC